MNVTSWWLVATITSFIMFVVGIFVGATSMTHLTEHEARKIAARMLTSIESHSWKTLTDEELYDKMRVYRTDLRRLERNAVRNRLHLPGWKRRNRRRVIRAIRDIKGGLG